MKIPSCTHSFAVFLASSVITFQPSFALSVDSKDAAILQPRLAVTSGPDTSTSPTRRRKKCSFTPASGKESATANAYSTGTAPSASIVTGSLFGFSRSNASILASHLPYSRSSPCKPKTRTIYLPSPSSTHSPMASAADQGSPEGSAVLQGRHPRVLTWRTQMKTQAQDHQWPEMAVRYHLQHLQLVTVFQAPEKTQILAQQHPH